MVNCCYMCGSSNKLDKDVILLSIPNIDSRSKWHIEFMKHLGIQDVKDKDIHICSRHFNPDDFKMMNHNWSLKGNVLSIIENENDEIEDQEIDIKPELIYLKYENEGDESLDSTSKSDDTTELTSLEPLVEYVDIYEQDLQVDVIDIKDETIGENKESDTSDILQSNCTVEGNGSQVISIVSSEDNLEIEPMLPYFLTSSPVFTILNENNEVGETIIVQVENPEEKKDPIPDLNIRELHKILCKSKDSDISKYNCGICDESYGCINCLKSHYHTLHITSTITRFKCKISDNHISKHMVCPVCELTFKSRSETVDHYVTHSAECEICGCGFDRLVHLTDHYQTAHNKGDYKAAYECEICKRVYQFPLSLTKHYQTFHKMIWCYICRLTFDRIEELQDHEKTHRRKLDVLPYACSKCDMAFSKISDIAVHIRRDHKKEDCNDSKPIQDDDQLPLEKKLKVEK